MKAFEFVIFRHNDDIEINYIVVAETEKEAWDKLPMGRSAVMVNEYKNLILATNNTAIIKAVEAIKEQIEEECYYGAKEACTDLIEELDDGN